MASEEHKNLAQFLKETHNSLRKSALELGVEKAWRNHCENKDVLSSYSECMKTLATTHWEENCESDTSAATSRIKWAADECKDYFINKKYLECYQKELQIAEKLNIQIDQTDIFSVPLKLIDVGSCYNPFKEYEFLDVFAIDLCPANSSVLQCDFLNVEIGCNTINNDYTVLELKKESFDVVTFCFLLEYIPTSELRIIACEKAYQILKPGGLLIINTPDSKHVGANSRLLKCWRYSLALLGFSRIKYQKFTHMHCMAFRKCVCKAVAVRWADLHKESYMDFAINIPQDFQKAAAPISHTPKQKLEISKEDFEELPFSSAMNT